MTGGITRFLGLESGGCAAIVGAGGKTSLIRLLAWQNSRGPVLVSPTTKMYPLAEAQTLCTRPQDCPMPPGPGIVCAGRQNPATGKLEAFSLPELEQLCRQFPLALLEADGSWGLPCKGWLQTEPVVPPFATTTIGVLTLAGFGRPATAEFVLNLPEFLQLAGLEEGQPIPLRAIAAMAAAPGGMFKNAVGTRQLVINQIENSEQLDTALLLMDEIRQQAPGLIQRFIVGSVHQNHWQVAGK